MEKFKATIKKTERGKLETESKSLEGLSRIPKWWAFVIPEIENSRT